MSGLHSVLLHVSVLVVAAVVITLLQCCVAGGRRILERRRERRQRLDRDCELDVIRVERPRVVTLCQVETADPHQMPERVAG